ncbi:hypothetical protein JCM5350_005093, partial [Sporobolomyces pararoseus]
SIPAAQHLPNHSYQNEARYVQQRQPAPSAYNTHVLAHSPNHFSHPHPPSTSASSPHGMPPSDPQRPPNALNQSHHRQVSTRQVPARRMSVEQSNSANLPPPSGSPRSQPSAPSPAYPLQHPQSQAHVQPRLAQSRVPHGLATRRIQEEEEREEELEPVTQSRNQPQFTTRIVESPGLQSNAVPRQQPPVGQRQSRPSNESTVSPTSIAIFHTYVLDYLQKAGFHTTAAAFLSESPGVFTHPLSASRSYPSKSTSQTRKPAASPLSTSPTSASHPQTRNSPSSMPLFRAESGSSPTSPSQHDASNHSTIESTSSTSTTSHYGFDQTKSDQGMEDELPSPGEDKKRNSDRRSGDRGLIPAADVEHEVESGFLYEWFHVFYDVHSARLKTGGSNQARSLLANNAATPSIGKRLRPIPSDRVLVQPPRIMQAQSVNTVGLTARQPLARRPSNAQSLANGRDPSTSTVDQRRNIVERGLSAQAGSHAGSQAPSLARRNSQHQFIQHQRENQARQQALLERQKLQQIQMDQVELQNQMLSNSRQNSGSGSSPTKSIPSGVPGYAPDRLAKANETFNNYRASLVANQRAQLTQGSPKHQPLASSPQPIPDGSRYVLREALPQDPAQLSRNEGEALNKPTLQRTHSQPQVQRFQSSPQDSLMPPSTSLNNSQQGRPALTRSASTSLVHEDQDVPGLVEELNSQSNKRRRDSIVSNGGLEAREIKKVRSSIDLGSQVRTSTPVIKSPLALETDFSAVSPSSTTPKTSTSEGKTTEAHKSQVRRQEPIPSQDPPSQPVVSLDDTEALLATLDAKNGQSAIEATTDLSALNELEVPTMTDAELDAFFAASMSNMEDPANSSQALVVENTTHPNPPISIPDTADFDFSEYESFFGSGATSYDPTTYDLRV